MKDPLDQTRQRSLQYWYIDGSFEIAFGALCLLLGLYFYGQTSLPHASLLYKILDMSFVVIIIGGGLAANKLVKTFKERVTYRRTGYVAYQQARPGPQRALRVGASMVVAFVIAVMFNRVFAGHAVSRIWMPAVSSAVFCLAFLFVAIRIGLNRFYLLAAGMGLTGLAIASAEVGDLGGLVFFYIAAALLLVVSGGLTLAAYLRGTSAPEENGHES